MVKAKTKTPAGNIAAQIDEAIAGASPQPSWLDRMGANLVDYPAALCTVLARRATGYVTEIGVEVAVNVLMRRAQRKLAEQAAPAQVEASA